MYRQLETREDILSAWEMVSEEHGRADEADLMSFKHLIFDTYWYFRRTKEFNSVLRDDLPIYRLVYRFWVEGGVWSWLRGYEEYVTGTCLDTAQGLTWSIDNGFERGRYESMLPTGLSEIRGMEDELDMSAYESYEQGFRKQLVSSMRDQIEFEEDDELPDEERLNEDEELRKIAATKDS